MYINICEPKQAEVGARKHMDRTIYLQTKNANEIEVRASGHS